MDLATTIPVLEGWRSTAKPRAPWNISPTKTPLRFGLSLESNTRLTFAGKHQRVAPCWTRCSFCAIPAAPLSPAMTIRAWVRIQASCSRPPHPGTIRWRPSHPGPMMWAPTPCRPARPSSVSPSLRTTRIEPRAIRAARRSPSPSLVLTASRQRSMWPGRLPEPVPIQPMPPILPAPCWTPGRPATSHLPPARPARR